MKNNVKQFYSNKKNRYILKKKIIDAVLFGVVSAQSFSQQCKNKEFLSRVQEIN